MTQLEKYKDQFILFCEAGFIAVNQADEDAATKLFKASMLLNPKNVLPSIGMGYMHLCKLELKQACKLFEEVLAKEPSNEMAKTFLGLSLSLTPNEVTKGEKILEESAHKAHDPMVKNLAHTAIDFVEKFVKKSPTPMQNPKPEKKNRDNKAKE
jgi:lipopolysaccharide biosynthesis regulator YciM